MSITQEKGLQPRHGIVPHLRTRARLFARHNIRNSEFGLTVVAAALGVVIALGVALVREMGQECGVETRRRKRNATRAPDLAG